MLCLIDIGDLLTIQMDLEMTGVVFPIAAFYGWCVFWWSFNISVIVVNVKNPATIVLIIFFHWR